MDVCRLGNNNTKRGKIVKTKNQNVFVNGKLIATNNDVVVYPNLPPTVTANGSTSVFIGGVGVTYKGNKDADGNVRVDGDTTVKIGG